MRNLVLRGLPRGWVLGCVVSFVAIPVMGAESLPASVRACSALADSLQRLVCYDREVAKFPAPVASSGAPAGQAARGHGAAPTGQTASGGSSAAGTASGGGAGVTSGFAVATTPGAQGPAAVTTTAGAQGSTAAPSAPGAAGTNGVTAGTNSPAAAPKSNSTSVTMASGDAHFTAHIVSIDRQPNEMVLHLDNGQVWQEMQSVSGDLSLREGDSVKIDRHFGSFWLTGPHVSSMKVQRKT